MFTFIGSSIFERELHYYLNDDEYGDLQKFLMENPLAGDLVQRSGGVSKLRWKRPGTGKRGGIRVIYYVQFQPNEFWMLTLYAKSKQENAPAHILKALKETFNA